MKQNTNIPTNLLRINEVHVWVFDLTDQDLNHYSWEQLLSQEEMDRSKGYQFDRDGRLFMAQRGILRKLISRYTGLDLAKINYDTNPYKKIFLPDHLLSFNISHSQNKIAFAFAMGKDIGVDIEQVRSLPDHIQLMEHWFSKDEKAGFSLLPKNSHLEAFYHVWTQKEAFIKAEGKGLVRNLQDFSVSVDPGKPAKMLKIKDGDASLWNIVSDVRDPGWRIAVCVRSKKKQKVLWYKPELSFILS